MRLGQEIIKLSGFKVLLKFKALSILLAIIFNTQTFPPPQQTLKPLFNFYRTIDPT